MNTKSFKEYLLESKQTYEFKIKIAGECPDEVSSKIKEALSIYDCENCSSGNRLPIQESHFDFRKLAFNDMNTNDHFAFVNVKQKKDGFKNGVENCC